MTQEVALWIAGVAVAVIGALALAVLNSIKKQGEDTNLKVTAQGEAFARLETSVVHLTTDVRSLNTWRQDVTARALAAAELRAIEAERRFGESDRRGAS